MIRVIEAGLDPWKALVEKMKWLGKTKEYNHVDDAKGEHIASYHAVDHGDEWSSQSHCPATDKPCFTPAPSAAITNPYYPSSLLSLSAFAIVSESHLKSPEIDGQSKFPPVYPITPQPHIHIYQSTFVDFLSFSLTIQIPKLYACNIRLVYAYIHLCQRDSHRASTYIGGRCYTNTHSERLRFMLNVQMQRVVLINNVLDLDGGGSCWFYR